MIDPCGSAPLVAGWSSRGMQGTRLAAADLGAAAADPDRQAERRRRVAEPDLGFREFCRRSKLSQSKRSWDLFADERYRRGETDIPSYEEYNPFRRRQQGPYA
jgi:hypothetical protein